MKKLFAIKKTSPAVPAAPAIPELSRPITVEATTTENVKAKMDLLLTQLESLNVRYETFNQRLANVERMIQEIYVIAKRP